MMSSSDVTDESGVCFCYAAVAGITDIAGSIYRYIVSDMIVNDWCRDYGRGVDGTHMNTTIIRDAFMSTLWVDRDRW